MPYTPAASVLFYKTKQHTQTHAQTAHTVSHTPRTCTRLPLPNSGGGPPHSFPATYGAGGGRYAGESPRLGHLDGGCSATGGMTVLAPPKTALAVYWRGRLWRGWAWQPWGETKSGEKPEVESEKTIHSMYYMYYHATVCTTTRQPRATTSLLRRGCRAVARQPRPLGGRCVAWSPRAVAARRYSNCPIFLPGGDALHQYRHCRGPAPPAPRPPRPPGRARERPSLVSGTRNVSRKLRVAVVQSSRPSPAGTPGVQTTRPRARKV